MSEQVAKDPLAEKGILASVFEDPDVFPLVSEILAPEDFYEPAHSLLYAVMLSMYQAGESIGVIQVQHHLSREGTLAQAGGLQYLLELTNPEAPYAYIAALTDYVEIVRENADLRRLQAAHRAAEEKARPGSGYTFDEALTFSENALHQISEVSVRSDIANMLHFVEDEFAAIIERGEMPDGVATGVPSGFIDLDDKTTGFHPGQMVIIGARPAMGKSTLAVDFVRGAAIRAGKTALFFSLEMSKEEIIQRVLSAESLVELQKLRTGKGLNKDDWHRLQRAREEISDANIMIDDNPSLSLVNLRTKCLRQKAKPEGLDIVIVDYLQLMEVEVKGSNATREQQISAVSRGVKLLAKEIQVPIIILCQLNRGVENRSDKVPAASDLRESGSLEQDADMIFLLHRPEAYDVNDRPGQADLIIAKQRNGPTGKVVLVPLLNVSKFASAIGMFPADFTEPDADGDTPPDTGYDPYALPDELPADDPFSMPSEGNSPKLHDQIYPPSETIVNDNNDQSNMATRGSEEDPFAW
jgi:replicative DNA helicase